MSAPPGFADLSDAIDRLLPEFASRAAENDQDKSYPKANMEALVGLGLPGMFLPRAIGGLGLTLRQQIEVTEKISQADGSTALALSMHRVSSELVMWKDFPFGQKVMREACSAGSMLCSVVSIPTTETDSRKGGLVAEDKGDHWLISGRSGFATNSEGATYIVLVCGIEGRRGLLIALADLKSPEISLLLNWAGMGMRASSSHDVTVTNLKLPKEQGYELPAERIRELSDDHPSRAGQYAIMGVWSGLTKAALDFSLTYLANRHGFMAGKTFNNQRPELDQVRGEQAWAQIVVGKMECRLWAARTALYAFADRFDAGGYADPQQLKIDRMHLHYVVREAVEEVMLSALKVCGAHAYVTTKPLERIVRDGLAGIVMREKNDQLAQALGMFALAPLLAGSSAPISPVQVDAALEDAVGVAP